jgi:hypothetical protein
MSSGNGLDYRCGAAKDLTEIVVKGGGEMRSDRPEPNLLTMPQIANQTCVLSS